MSKLIFKKFECLDNSSSDECCEQLPHFSSVLKDKRKKKGKARLRRGADEEGDEVREEEMGGDEEERERFEREMNEELEPRLAELRGYSTKEDVSEGGKTGRKILKAKGSGLRARKSQTCYNQQYFDSDDDDDGDGDRRWEQRRVRSNDELFYDPLKDEEDEAWLAKLRAKYQPAQNSDAILNCPACMSVLCVDCQKHEIYQNQYRAMFVLNCRPKMDEVLVYPEKKLRGEYRRGRGKQSVRDGLEVNVGGGGGGGRDKFHPVQCEICRTEVAVYDEDEVYHFYNALASHA